MGTEPPGLTVDGNEIRAGTSLFHKRTQEVLWVRDVHEEYLQLETVSEAFKIHRTQFERQMVEGNIVVESRPHELASDPTS